MKKVRLLFFVILCSCTKSFPATTPLVSESSSNTMSYEEMYNFISSKIKQTKSSNSFSLSEVCAVSGDEGPQCYLVNYEKGWELISADKRNPKSIMECAEGNLASGKDIYFNPAQELFLNGQLKRISSELASSSTSKNIEISYLNKDDILLENESASKYTDTQSRLSSRPIYLNDTTIITSCNHIVPTKWGYNYPWNTKTPYKDSLRVNHCSPGCTMIAIAQYLYFLMNEYDYDIKFYSDFYSDAVIPSDSSQYLTLSDNDIHFTEASYGNHYAAMPCTNAGTGTDIVASFLVYLGYNLNAKYKQNGTGASLFSAQSFLVNEYNISTVITGDKSSYPETIDNIIYHAYPVIAQITNNDGEGGHVVIIDALKKSVRTYDVYYRIEVVKPGGGFQYILRYSHTETETTWQIGLNWGWNGVGDSINGEPVWYNIDGELQHPIYSNCFDTIKRIMY